MGGKTFNDLELRVPRMPPDVYHRMIADIHPKLQSLFKNVIVPRDAPGKTDYGDIDFLVGGVLPQDAPLWKLVQDTLGADYHKDQGSHSFALPHPEIDGAHVQVDVELCPSEDLFEWTKFMKGDADLLQIIGIAHRPLGLRCSDKGLHVRLEQIEPYDKKEARLFLTSEPDQAMRFYGLDVEKYRDGFNNESELFDWVADGRFFSREVFEQRVEKADDRTRQSKRPMYSHFVEEFMPTFKGGSSKIWTRQEVLQEALETFKAQAPYDQKMAKHNLEEAEKLLWEEVKAVIPAKDKSLKAAVRALRRWVGFSDDKPLRLQRPQGPDEYFKWAEYVDQSNIAQVLKWVEQNWRDVKSHDRAHGAAAKTSPQDHGPRMQV